jgi:hypothetical protein
VSRSIKRKWIRSSNGARNLPLSAIEVRPLALSRVRNIVDVIFSFDQSRNRRRREAISGSI